MGIDGIKNIGVLITINGVDILKKIKSNHCMMMVLASAQIDNILSKSKGTLIFFLTITARKYLT
jgi:hypothetical protein